MSEIKIGLIGGSGLGELLAQRGGGAGHEVQTPFGPPSDAIVETRWQELPLFFLSRHGPGHLLGPSQVPYRANIFALKKLGVTHVIASGAVGSLRDEFRPRDLVIPDQLIDKTSRRPASFYEHAAVHVEFAEPFCPVLRQILVDEGSGVRVRDEGSGFRGQGSEMTSQSQPLNPEPRILTAQTEPRTPNPEPSFQVHGRGCYVCMEGPAFSTRAESLMHRLWGGDLIGMTCLPEARLAREAEIAYAMIALVTDYDCWKRPPATAPGSEQKMDPAVLLKEIIANLRAASDNAMALIERALRRIAADPAALAASPALGALQLAIWSDKSRIDRRQVELLAPLWMKYFDASAAGS